MKFSYFFAILLSLNFSTILSAQDRGFDYTTYVNPFIGTAGDGNTYPGAVVPWGMAYVNPYSFEPSVSGYNTTSYKKNAPSISGFSHASLSGVGCADLGSILLMPSQGDTSSFTSMYKSAYSNEVATAGYYANTLSTYNIQAEMSATTRTGISRYKFNKAGNAHVLLDLGRGLSTQSGGFIQKVNNSEVEGYKQAGGFCGANNQQRVYFVVQVRKKEVRILRNNDSINPLCWFTFKVVAGESIEVKVGLSYVSTTNARINLKAEQPGWNFDIVKKNAQKEWNKELSKIAVTGKNENDKVIFYTGLYHTLLHPNVFNDVNGEYRSMTAQLIKKTEKGRNRYTVFSLWDTYRNLHALLCLVYPERQADMVQSMTDMYSESGWLPKWELAGYETYVMVGDPAAAVIAETYLKGIRHFDVATAYKGMLKNASVQLPYNPLRPGLEHYEQFGYIPNDIKDTGRKFVWGSVATTLEYNYADASISRLAKALGDDENAITFEKRAARYQHLFDTTTSFIRPKLSNGEWFHPFDPLAVNGELSWNPSGGPGFVEGNAWQYTWMVPHDMYGLQKLMGGKEQFVSKLQKCFDSSYFVLWNEPDMAYPFLFNYCGGQEWRSQKESYQSLKKHFFNKPDGIPGNDDCGTLSAWVIFTMMGLYPADPSSAAYTITAPLFDSVRIKLNADYYKGKNIFISKQSTNEADYFIKEKTLNEHPFSEWFINHSILVKGARLHHIVTANH